MGTISNLQAKDQANLTLEQIRKSPCLKDDATLALLIAISPHMVVMFNKINNLLKLDVILNGAQFPSLIVLVNNVVVSSRGNNRL